MNLKTRSGRRRDCHRLYRLSGHDFYFTVYHFWQWAGCSLVLLNVPFAMIGGILALHVTGTVFSISAGIGFIALFGICIQNGVILISVFKQNLHRKIR